MQKKPRFPHQDFSCSTPKTGERFKIESRYYVEIRCILIHISLHEQSAPSALAGDGGVLYTFISP